MKQRIVLYGTGLEGERFYWSHREDYDIEYCVDRNCHRKKFHGIWVYGIDEVKDTLQNSFVIIAAVGEAYITIEKILHDLGMREFDNYLGANLVGKKLAILYGNCHMEVLKQYLIGNPYFIRQYDVRTHMVHIAEKSYPLEEIDHCDLLIGQDIRENNGYGVLSIDALIEKTKENCRCIRIPNAYGCNLFWPQLKTGSSIDYMSKHLNGEAIAIECYSEREKNAIRDNVKRWAFFGDINIERMYFGGASIEEIVSYIKDSEVYAADDIRENFRAHITKIKEREQLCDIRISDYIEENYQKHHLFYNPAHPTELLICEKGRRILQLLDCPVEESVFIDSALDFNETYIYGCVKRALGMTYEQEFIRKNAKSTLKHRAINLTEYVEEYIAWVCKA